MSRSVLLVSDSEGRSKSVAEDFEASFNVVVSMLHYSPIQEVSHFLFLIVDIDLADNDAVKRLNGLFETEYQALETVFLIRDRRLDRVQANALGAGQVVKHPIRPNDVKRLLLAYSADRNDGPGGGAISSEEVLQDVLALQNEFDECVRAKKPLPKDKILSCSEEMVTSLSENTIGSWLQVVRSYHSYTHRHCMTVSGLIVAFGLHLGMRRSDVQFLALGGLVHDIGKVRIPLSVLDKPGKLTPDERALINLHPGYSAEILTLDGQFSEAVIDMALHHHEMLDGSGYPDGLAGDEIADSVRLLTIVDIFSALIDKRSYKDAMSGEEAYRILRGMQGKLEACLVKAFKPVALQVRNENDPALQVAV